VIATGRDHHRGREQKELSCESSPILLLPARCIDVDEGRYRLQVHNRVQGQDEDQADGQWEDIEIEMNSAFDENYSSDDEYVPHIPDADISMSSTGKEIVCMGACGGKFWSASGTSTHCLSCRD
jgi:hypothetical protein